MTLLKEKASDHTIFSYLEMLKNKKKLTMRNGSFGLVLIPQSRKYVYRIWADDPAYDEWAKIMIKNQDNLAVPEVFRKVKTITGKFLSGTIQLKVMKMEYLIDLPFSCNIDLFDNKENEEVHMPLSSVLTSIWRKRSNFERDYKILSPQLLNQYSDVVDIIKQLSKIPNIEPDFEVQGNIMQRTNGEYVISDPVKMFVDNMVKLPAIRDKDSITDDIPLSVEKILRIQSDLARSQAIRKYDFTEDEIKQLMSDPKIKAEVQIELERKYVDRAKQYSHINDISMDDLEEFLKQFDK